MIQRMTDGRPYHYTSMGSYPLFYVYDHHTLLCVDCAVEVVEKNARFDEDMEGHANWEDPQLHCYECDTRIESAYAEEIEEEESEDE